MIHIKIIFLLLRLLSASKHSYWTRSLSFFFTFCLLSKNKRKTKKKYTTHITFISFASLFGPVKFSCFIVFFFFISGSVFRYLWFECTYLHLFTFVNRNITVSLISAVQRFSISSMVSSVWLTSIHVIY